MKRYITISYLTLFLAGCDGGIGIGTIGKLIPQILFNTSSLVMEVGQPITLTWSSSDSQSCIASGSWSGKKSTSGSETVMVNLPGNNQYHLSCQSTSSQTTIATLLVMGQRTFIGKVIDGYIRGATVFIDKNNNFINDIDEPFVITDNQGEFKLVYDNGNLISLGGFDLDTGNSMEALVMSVPLLGYSEFKTITPLTSLLSHMQNPNVLNSALGIVETIDLTKTDPIALKEQSAIYPYIFEKGNQVAIFALSLQVYMNELTNSDNLALEAYKSIASIIESEYLATNEIVNIESEQYIDGVIEHFIKHSNNENIKSSSVSNLKTILSNIIPILGFKETDYASNALITFATSTLSKDIKSIANGTFDNLRLTAYRDDIINYIATDQAINPLDLMAIDDSNIYISNNINTDQDLFEDESGISNVIVMNYALITDDSLLPVNLSNMATNQDGTLTFDLFVNPSIYSYPGLSGIDLSIYYNEKDMSMLSSGLNLNIDGLSIINDKKSDQIRLFWASNNGINILKDIKIGSLTLTPKNITDGTIISVKSVLYGGDIDSIDSFASPADQTLYKFISSSTILN